MAIAIAAVAAAVVGAGRLLTVSLAAHAQLRPTLALVPPAPESAPVGREAQWKIVAGLSLPEPHVALAPPPVSTPAPVVQAASAAPAAAADDVAVTGSLGAESSPRAAAEPRGLIAKLLARHEAPHLPLPRARPTLRPVFAALTPAETPASKLDEDNASLRTAIYDITARAVYLPNGERLEAHSGLGSLMDDPRHIGRKNQGPTPPNVYTLTLREKLFHGVRAIRMTPANESAMFGRDGILAHSYMLGANGQSNGCVSFKDYPKFLRAFLDGEVDRMVVVTRLAKPPATYARRRTMRSASAM